MKLTEMLKIWEENNKENLNDMPNISIKQDKLLSVVLKPEIETQESIAQHTLTGLDVGENVAANKVTTPKVLPFKETIKRLWKNVPLIEMLPAGRRAEASAILAEHPEFEEILRKCKQGQCDCWTAMEIIGLPDPFSPFRPGSKPE